MINFPGFISFFHVIGKGCTVKLLSKAFIGGGGGGGAKDFSI